MSARTARLDLPPRLNVETVLGAMDRGAQRTARQARTFATRSIRRRLPARTRTLQRATRGSVRRTRDGYVITVTPRPERYARGGVTAREVARFVEGGTGVPGPTGQPITPRKAEAFPEPFGVEVRGQEPRRPFARAEREDGPAVERILARGAQDAARDAEAVLRRTT